MAISGISDMYVLHTGTSGSLVSVYVACIGMYETWVVRRERD